MHMSTINYNRYTLLFSKVNYISHIVVYSFVHNYNLTIGAILLIWQDVFLSNIYYIFYYIIEATITN